MQTKKTTRNDWLAASLRAMGDGGVEAVRVEPLARSLGVTKGSFYWHFRDRNDLLEAMLDAWETGGTEKIVEQVEKAAGSAFERALRLWELTSGRRRITTELAIRDWAQREPRVAARVRRVDERRRQYLHALLREMRVPESELEARALLLKCLLVGNHLVRSGRRSPAHNRVIREAIEICLGARGSTPKA